VIPARAGLPALELAALLAALAAANFAFAPGDPGLLHVSPHPLFAVVAIVALRHGAAAGFAGGALAALLHVGFAARFAGHAGPATPLLLLAAGAALGEVRSRERARALRAEDDARRARAERDALEARAAAAEQSRLALERRMLEPGARVALLAEAAGRLERLDEPELFAAMLALFAEHLDAESAAVYALEGGRLKRRAARGPAAAAEERDPAQGLLGLALGARRVASARDLGDAAGPAEAMLAAPLFAQDGAPLGAIEVRAMPFVSLTASAERIAALLADWCARAWERARQRPALAAEPEAGEPAGPSDAAWLARRLVEEIARSRRTGEPLSLLLLEIDDWDDVPAAARPAVRRAAAAALRAALRTSDAVFGGREERAIAAVLAGADAEGAKLAAHRAADALAALRLEPYRSGPAALRFGLGAATWSEALGGPAELLAAAGRARKPAPDAGLPAAAAEEARAP
jgi:hypothetical protein